MVLPSPATVSGRALASLVVAEGLGELHKVLEPEALWYPPEEARAERGAVDELLTVQGWRDRDGRLEREVAASLAVLCRPDEEFYGWATHDDVTFGLLAARIGRDGMLAMARPDGTISLARVPSARLAERLVAQLPDVPPASFTPATVSVADVRATGPSGRQRTASSVMSRRASPETRQVRELSTLPTVGGGELSVAARDRWGHRTRAEAPLRYADTGLGRIANLVVGQRVRVEPGSRAVLAAELRKMRTALSVQ